MSPPDTGRADAGPALHTCGPVLGYACGSRIGMDPDALYTCLGGDAGPQLAQQCAGECFDLDGGEAACPCPAGDGTYCGNAVGREAGSVYRCTGGALTLVHACAASCVAQGSTSAACSACPNGDGLYCGGSQVSGDPSILYSCAAGVLTVAQRCGHTCTVEAAGTNDNCGPCPYGNGAYCGGPVGLDPNTLYTCQNAVYSVTEHCPSTCHTASAGQNDYCDGQGLSCGNVQWWNATLTYQWTVWNGGIDWYDTDLGIRTHTPVQLRHDSRLEQHPVEPWGWQPRFVDMVTGQRFQFLHLQPTAQYTTTDGQVYPAGTVVGLSGGDSAATGYPTYSTGAHLCVESIHPWTSVFPAGQDPCH